MPGGRGVLAANTLFIPTHLAEQPAEAQQAFIQIARVDHNAR